MSDETKQIQSDAVVVRPHDFTYAINSTTATGIVKSQSAFDLKLQHTCNHRLSTGNYKLATCPRCLGTGYYYDIKFNASGQLTRVEIEDKLIQALEKFILTSDNKFHTNVSVGLTQWLGYIANRDNIGIITDEIVKALANLQQIQQTTPNLSPRAKISTINSISAQLISVDTLEYKIILTAASGDEKTITGTINLNT